MRHFVKLITILAFIAAYSIGLLGCSTTGPSKTVQHKDSGGTRISGDGSGSDGSGDDNY